MAETEESWLAGDIGRAQVGVLAEARRCSDDCFERDESLLVGQAQDLQYRHFANTVAYWCQLADPDGAEAKAKADYESRRLHLSKSWQGRYFLDGIFDPIGGEIFATTLAGIEKEFFDADWAEAKARLGEDATDRLTCAAAPPSAGPTPRWRWPGGRGRCPRARAGPSRCSPCSWAMRPSPGVSASWPAPAWSAPAAWCRGWTRRGWSGWSSTAPTASRT